MKKLGNEEIIRYLQMFENYMGEYGRQYGPLMAFQLGIELLNDSVKHDLVMQLRALFGMLNDSENIYLNFAKVVGDRYGWKTKILEIGGGRYPMFSKYVDDNQRDVGGGTITVIDPLIVTDKLGNVKLQKQSFSSDMGVSDFELLVGICPCDATKDIIESAVINKKEFFIVLCNCPTIEGFSITDESRYDVGVEYLEKSNPARAKRVKSLGISEEILEQFGILVPELEKKALENAVFRLAKQQEADGFNVTKENLFGHTVISSARKV